MELAILLLFAIQVSINLASVILFNGGQGLEWLQDEEGASWESGDHFEGDMVLTQDQQRNGMIADTYRWPNKTVVYYFDRSVNEDFKEKITEIIQYFPKNTCVQVKERTVEADYVNVTSDNTGCHSHVGRTGGAQVLNLKNPGCVGNGTVLHEFLHALGFHHMQSTHNRDDYVDILFENIQEGKENNFRKSDSATVSNFNQRYDLKSVMHYSEKAFSKNGEPTIRAKDGTTPLGNREGLTETDRLRLIKMYEC